MVVGWGEYDMSSRRKSYEQGRKQKFIAVKKEARETQQKIYKTNLTLKLEESSRKKTTVGVWEIHCDAFNFTALKLVGRKLAQTRQRRRANDVRPLFA